MLAFERSRVMLCLVQVIMELSAQGRVLYICRRGQTLLSVIKRNERSGVYEASEATTMATEASSTLAPAGFS